MLKFIRYAIAALFFAASVGCLALWWRSFDRHDFLYGTLANGRTLIHLALGQGTAAVHTLEMPKRTPRPIKWSHVSSNQTEKNKQLRIGSFQASHLGISFPLWYPALVFALASVGVLRFRRQFSIRSALIVTATVAALIGTAVIF